jgi:hypothetical protein
MSFAPNRPIRRVQRGSLLLLAGAFVLAACGTGTASAPAQTTQVGGVTSAPQSAAPASAAPTADARTPAPTALSLMPLGMLPNAEVPTDVEVSCEDPAGATLTCEDAVALAARIGITMTGGSPVEQVLVERDAANADIVTLTYWAVDPEAPDAGPVAFTTTIDQEAQTMTFPTQNDEAVFPAS